MIQVSQKKWDSIPENYKGVFNSEDHPELLGKRTVLSGSISTEMFGLFFEGIHFEIIQGDVNVLKS